MRKRIKPPEILKILLECKSHHVIQWDCAQQSAAHDTLLQELRNMKVSTLVITHPDSDHGSIALDGDPNQLPTLPGNHDVDIVFYTDDVTFMRIPHHGTAQIEPPAAGESILRYVCPADRLEAVIGDLNEGFMKQMAHHGPLAAKRWYWWQVVRSLGMFCGKLLAAAALVHDWLKKLGF